MNNIEQKVHQAMDNAARNGYDMQSPSLEQIADDLVSNDADLEKCKPKTLIPYIRAWRLTHEG